MAISDITAGPKANVGNLDFTYHTNIFQKVRIINFAKQTELGTQFAHPIFDILVGEALTGYQLVIHTSLTGASATITFQNSAAVAWSSAITATTLDAGMVLTVTSNIPTGDTTNPIVGKADAYAHTTASTFDMDINTADVTGGIMMISGHFIKNLDSTFASA